MHNVKIILGLGLFMFGLYILGLTFTQIADEWDLNDFKQPITIGYITFGGICAIIGFFSLKSGSKEWERDEKLDMEIKEKSKEKLELEIANLKANQSNTTRKRS